MNSTVILSDLYVCSKVVVNSFELGVPAITPSRTPIIAPTKAPSKYDPSTCSLTKPASLTDAAISSIQRAVNEVGCGGKCNTTVTQTYYCVNVISSSRKLLSTGTSCNTIFASFVIVLFKLDVAAETLGYTSDTVTQLDKYIQGNLEVGVNTGSFITLTKKYAAVFNDTSFKNSSVTESFTVKTTQIEYLVTVSPTRSPTSIPSALPVAPPSLGSSNLTINIFVFNFHALMIH